MFSKALFLLLFSFAGLYYSPSVQKPAGLSLEFQFNGGLAFGLHKKIQ